MQIEKNAKHAHPITILYNLKRFVPLFFIPLLRGFLSALQGDMAGWLEGAWMDILVVLTILILSVVSWRFYTYSYDMDGIYLFRGWLRTRATLLPWGKVATISQTHRFFLRPVQAVYLRADSLGGNRRQTDVVIYLSKEEGKELFSVYKELKDEGTIHYVYEPKFSSIVLLSFLSTNSFVGVIYIATFISQSGKILGRNFQDMLIETFEEATRKWAFRIPPAAMAIAYLFLLAWLIGMILTLLRYRNFSVSRSERMLYIRGGVLTTREYAITQDQILYLDIRQNLVTYVLRLYSMYVTAIGNGKDKNDISRVIPLERLTALRNTSGKLFPNLRDSSLSVRPNLRGIMAYIRLPLILCLSVPLAVVVILYAIPSWKRFTLFVGVMALIPCLFLLLIRVADFLTAGIGYRNGLFTVKFSKHFTLHTLIIPEDKVVKIKVRQSPWQQRFSGRCHFQLYTVAEGRKMHQVRNLNKIDVDYFLRTIETR